MIFSNLLISKNATIKEAFKKISKGGHKCLIVTTSDGFLEGTISDGDLRKSILSKKNLDLKIHQTYNNKPYSVNENYKIEQVKKTFISKNYDLIPVVNKNNKVIDVLTWAKIFKNEKKISKLKNIVMIMAGGKGTRLDPFTRVLPKPLIPVKDKTIIEHILCEFINNGLNKFIISINYKGKILKSFLEELKISRKINFIEETKPLGTIGSLKLMKEKTSDPILVANCDSLIKINYSDLITFHKKNKFDITILISSKEYRIPYGTCVLNGNLLELIREKPKFNFFTNVGMYLVSPDLVKLIPHKKTDAIQFIQLCKNMNKRIGVYPIDDEMWIDIGQWAEFQKNINKF
jgi:dTDP-glucose pyrophosphorylase